MMDRSHFNQKNMKNANCLREFFTKVDRNVHYLHGHMPGDAFSAGQLKCQQVLLKVIWEELRRKVPIGYNGMLQIRPQNCPLTITTRI